MITMKKCLYCLATDGKFSSVEHTIPRGLGNDEIILDKGVVCDRCNNGVLSDLDEVLLNFDPIKFNRSFYGLQSRTGKHVVYKSAAFNMQHTTPEHIHLNAEHSGKALQTREDGFTMNMKSSKKMTVPYLKQLARALYKIGLGLVYLDLGEEVAYSSRFDEVGQIVLGQIDFSGYLLIPKKGDVENTATVLHWDRELEGKPLSFFRFYYYGVDIYYEIEHRSIELPPEIPKEAVNFLRF